MAKKSVSEITLYKVLLELSRRHIDITKNIDRFFQHSIKKDSFGCLYKNIIKLHEAYATQDLTYRLSCIDEMISNFNFYEMQLRMLHEFHLISVSKEASLGELYAQCMFEISNWRNKTVEKIERRN